MNFFDAILRPAASAVVTEIQGLYGAFSFPEKLLQKVWLRGDFDRAASRLIDGRSLRVLYAGKWNLLGGPDFKSARIRMGDREITGDIELHLHATDWDAHGHAADPAYENVMLHVVLFPPAPGFVTRTKEGDAIPTLVLLPLLLHDLEEYAAAEAVETLANRPGLRAVEELAARSPAEVTTLIRQQAQRRWQQKVRFAGLRVQRLGWIEACHHLALEILGYRFNRVPMLRIAAQFPLARWSDDPAVEETAFLAEQEGWSLQGVRPANHPRTRLRQYARWQRALPDWPARLEESLREFSTKSEWPENTADFRRSCELTERRRALAQELCADQIAGTRFDNLICDGFLPLLAARCGLELEAAWFHWFAGDQPLHLAQALRALGLIGSRATPFCQGAAQGFLGWLIEREAREASQNNEGLSRGREA